MRARFVNENISFERGKDPKNAMGIGMVRPAEELFDLYDTLQELVCTTQYQEFQKGFNIESSKLIPSSLKPMTGWGNIHYEFKDLPRDQLYAFDKFIEKYSDLMGLNESVNFKRGVDPKEAMGIGAAAYNDIEDVMKYLVKKHGGSYTMDMTNSYIEGFFSHPIFFSGGRSIIYNMTSREFQMSFPGAPNPLNIKNLSEFTYDIDYDIDSRKKYLEY